MVMGSHWGAQALGPPDVSIGKRGSETGVLMLRVHIFASSRGDVICVVGRYRGSTACSAVDLSEEVGGRARDAPGSRALQHPVWSDDVGMGRRTD